MAEPAAPKAPVEYINNPFFIGAKGINLIFLKAQSTAILLVILSVLYVTGSSTPPQDTASSEMNFSPEIAAIIGLVVLLMIVASTFVNGIMSYTAAKAANDETVTLKEALSAVSKRFWSLLWLQILMGLKIFAWTLLFIVPGIIMAIRYSLASVAFFDKGLKGNAAIKHSIALTKGSWLTTLGGQTFFTIITFGIIDLLVGTASSAILYRQFSRTPASERPSVHWLSILTLAILILAFLIGIALAVFAVASTANYIDASTIEPAAL